MSDMKSWGKIVGSMIFISWVVNLSWRISEIFISCGFIFLIVMWVSIMDGYRRLSEMMMIFICILKLSSIIMIGMSVMIGIGCKSLIVRFSVLLVIWNSLSVMLRSELVLMLMM